MTMAAGCLVLGEGCKRQEQSSERQTLGVRVSITELREAFKNAPGNETQARLSETVVAVRYGQYTNALGTLQKLAGHPGLNAEQKKVTSKVISQVEKLAANSQAK